MAKVIIVGGGLFGRLAADLADETGHTVTVIDRHESEAGSPAAGCLFKPSWMAGVDWYDEALARLRATYGVRDIPFHVRGGGPMARVNIQHTDPSMILRHPDDTSYDLVSGNVVRVTSTGVTYEELEGGQRKTLQGWVYVATGVWASQLVSTVSIKPRRGVSLLAPIAMSKAKLDPWAPYKQALAFEMRPGVTWFGDGSAIKPENWTPDRDRQIDSRAVKLIRHRKAVGAARRIYGLRPMAGKGGIFERVRGRLVVGTGGGKMGTMLGVHFARRLMEEIG